MLPASNSLVPEDQMTEWPMIYLTNSQSERRAPVKSLRIKTALQNQIRHRHCHGSSVTTYSTIIIESVVVSTLEIRGQSDDTHKLSVVLHH